MDQSKLDAQSLINLGKSLTINNYTKTESMRDYGTFTFENPLERITSIKQNYSTIKPYLYANSLYIIYNRKYA